MQSSFMQPEAYEAEYYEVTTKAGETIIVPSEYFDPSDYPFATHEQFRGWLYRMSAPGYLDSTEWSAAATEAEALRDLLATYSSEEEPYAWEREAMERLVELGDEKAPQELADMVAEEIKAGRDDIYTGADGFVIEELWGTVAAFDRGPFASRPEFKVAYSRSPDDLFRSKRDDAPASILLIVDELQDGPELFVFWSEDCFQPPLYLVSSSSFEEAYEAFVDYAANHLGIAIDPDDLADYGVKDGNFDTFSGSFSSSGIACDTESIQGSSLKLDSLKLSVATVQPE